MNIGISIKGRGSIATVANAIDHILTNSNFKHYNLHVKCMNSDYEKLVSCLNKRFNYKSMTFKFYSTSIWNESHFRELFCVVSSVSGSNFSDVFIYNSGLKYEVYSKCFYSRFVDLVEGSSTCLLRSKSALSYYSKPSLINNGLLDKKIKRSSGKIEKFIESEFDFLNPKIENIEDFILLGEKDRLLSVSFSKYLFYLNQLDFQLPNIGPNLSEYIRSRKGFILKIDGLIKLYDNDERKSDVFYLLSFYFLKILESYSHSQKYNICANVSIRVLELYLTGYLLSQGLARVRKDDLQLHIKNANTGKLKWNRASGFGAMWGLFKSSIAYDIPKHIESRIDLVIKVRNKSMYGHGYLPVNQEFVSDCIITINDLIELIESNRHISKRYFTSMKERWVELSNLMYKELIISDF
ncbi:hypothetical protein [Vibrio diabolicus]|uniref:hypothetical protein n=2 Tax=Vibrio diabolicus TaxID=50719 RepID=UPI00215E53DD|nr:hypothetical protein [Vibrio diabolicus]MCS0391718.1 hypothetical protein [Vibrio diabolicus]